MGFGVGVDIIWDSLFNGFNVLEDIIVMGVFINVGCEIRDELVDVLMRNSLLGFVIIFCDYM